MEAGRFVVKQAVRQDARRTVREALDARRRSQMEAERRQATLAVTVLSAIAERQAAVAAADDAAATAVQALLGEGLELADIELLCGSTVGLKELQRLAKLPLRTPAEKAS